MLSLAAYFLLATGALAAVERRWDYPVGVPLVARQEPGTPHYLCHENCGLSITLSREPDYCELDEFQDRFQSCLECANTYGIWMYYQGSLIPAATACGIDPSPSPSGWEPTAEVTTTVPPAPETTTSEVVITTTDEPVTTTTTTTEAAVDEPTTTVPDVETTITDAETTTIPDAETTTVPETTTEAPAEEATTTDVITEEPVTTTSVWVPPVSANTTLTTTSVGTGSVIPTPTQTPPVGSAANKAIASVFGAGVAVLAMLAAF